MYLKLLIPLIIPFFSNFIDCFKTLSFWMEHYQKIQNNAETINEFNTTWCKNMETNSITKYQVCQRVFKLLRDDVAKDNPYRHSLYMNYDAFKLSLTNPEFPVCQEKNIPLVGKFMSLNCYGSQPIRSANSQNDKYLKEISVFYGMDGALIVLECSKSDAECEFREWYEYNEWHQFSDIPENVFNIPIPQYATIDKLKFEFHEYQHFNIRVKKFFKYTKSHLLQKENVNEETLSALCDLLLENRKFKYKVKYNTVKQSTRPYTTFITSFEQALTETENSHNEPKDIQKVTIPLKTLICTKYKYKPPIHIKMGFQILPGLDKNSVILIEPLIHENYKYSVPAALIENIHWVYVLNREKWF